MVSVVIAAAIVGPAALATERVTSGDETSGAGSPGFIVVAPSTGEEGVPRGPRIDFCPTPTQSETHLERYGFDYKPTVTCTREGEVVSPPAGDPNDVDHDEGLSESELERREESALRSATPTSHDGDPCTIDGEDKNGAPIEIVPFVCPEREVTPDEFADGVFG